MITPNLNNAEALSPSDQTVVQQWFNSKPWSTLRLCGNTVPPLKLRPINHLDSVAGCKKTHQTSSKCSESFETSVASEFIDVHLDHNSSKFQYPMRLRCTQYAACSSRAGCASRAGCSLGGTDSQKIQNHSESFRQM